MKFLLIAIFALVSAVAQAAEPFSDTPILGRAVLGNLVPKSRLAFAALNADFIRLVGCRIGVSVCTPAMNKMNDIIAQGERADGLAKLGLINRATNLAIRAVYEEIDVWSSPLETLTTGTGDCEDYVFVKYLALRVAGIPENDLRIVIVKVRNAQEHAVLAVRFEGYWRILDNLRFSLLIDNDILQYVPEYAISPENILVYGPQPH